MHNHHDWQITGINSSRTFFHVFTQFKERKTKQKQKTVSYLIAPFQHIPLTILHLVIDVEKLNDAVLSHVVSILLAFVPVQWRAL